MKQAAWTVVALVLAAGVAAAQEEPDKRLDDLRRSFEKSMKALQDKFSEEGSRLEKEFRAAREKLLGKPGEEKKEEKKAEKPRSLEEMVQRLLDRVEGLEKRLDQSVPRFQEFRRAIPRDFDFKSMPDELRKWTEKLPRFQQEDWKQWMEKMPRFRDENFKFDFKFPKDEKPKEKKKDEE